VIAYDGIMPIDTVTLARRIRWLDRNRRRLAIGIALLVIAPVVVMSCVWWTPPKLYAAFLTIQMAALSWYGIETALRVVQSIWETSHRALAGTVQLPRAVIFGRRN
jgi:hypothetical protein